MVATPMRWRTQLSDHRLFLSGSEFSDELRESLRRGGFLVQAHFDELQAVRERYWRARGETPVVLTITTTMDCNLGCYYCYEERSGKALKSTDISAIVDLAKDLVARSGRHSLHVDWYGGEPLLNLEFLEAASRELQAYSDRECVSYVASIISNGSSLAQRRRSLCGAQSHPPGSDFLRWAAGESRQAPTLPSWSWRRELVFLR